MIAAMVYTANIFNDTKYYDLHGSINEASNNNKVDVEVNLVAEEEQRVGVRKKTKYTDRVTNLTYHYTQFNQYQYAWRWDLDIFDGTLLGFSYNTVINGANYGESMFW